MIFIPPSIEKCIFACWFSATSRNVIIVMQNYVALVEEDKWVSLKPWSIEIRITRITLHHVDPAPPESPINCGGGGGSKKILYQRVNRKQSSANLHDFLKICNVGWFVIWIFLGHWSSMRFLVCVCVCVRALGPTSHHPRMEELDTL
jgi:hypothetical protein